MNAPSLSRSCAEAPAAGAPALSLVLPVPGDVRGLPPDTQFQRDAITMGEAIIVGTQPGRSVGLLPCPEPDRPSSRPTTGAACSADG